MAKVIKKKNDLLIKRNRETIIHIVGYILCLLCGTLCIELGFGGSPAPISLLMGALSFAGAVAIHCTRDNVGILSAGVTGEKTAASLVEKALPDTYYCITNAQIQYENRHNELDMIVVGPTGIFIVEVKNVSGTVSGSYFDKTLHQEKGKSSKDMNNPVNQVRQHADILSRYLKANGVRTWVQGVVLFVNPRARLDISDIPANGVPMFAVSEGGKEELSAYLRQSVSAPLKQEEIYRIIELI